MGEFTTFECGACGYRAEHIRWGAGQLDPRTRFLPAVCHHCQKIIEVELTGRDILIEEFTCPDCGHAVFFFEKGDSYKCPRCQTPDLGISQEGYW